MAEVKPDTRRAAFGWAGEAVRGQFLQDLRDWNVEFGFFPRAVGSQQIPVPSCVENRLEGTLGGK